MIRYLLDSSALWRILRDPVLRSAWSEVVSVGAIGSCQPQRVEFRRSARTIDEYHQMSGMFETLYPGGAGPRVRSMACCATWHTARSPAWTC
jgi:hypothetical protein